jgi:phospholipid/cholesterol/gamma-HCH transport system substrate-binding protein
MNKRAITVGIFIFIALAIFIAGVLALGGQNKTFADTITVRAIFNDVNGLQAGNNVHR